MRVRTHGRIRGGRTAIRRTRSDKGARLGFETLPVEPLAAGLVFCLCIQTLGAPVVLAELVLLAAIVLICWRRGAGIIGNGVFFLALPLFAILSALWSPVPDVSLRYGTQLLATVFIGIVLARTIGMGRLPLVVFAGAGAALVLGVVAGHTGPSEEGSVLIGFTGSKNQMGYVCLFWLLSALCVAGSRQSAWLVRGAALLCVPLAAFLLLQANATTALVSAVVLAGVLAALGIASYLPPAWRLFCLTVMLLIAGAALTATAEIEREAETFRADVLGKDDRLTGRTLLWEDADGLIAQKPLLGAGYKAVWLGPPGPGLLARYGQTDGRTYHFHDTVRELRVDLGLIGLTLFVLPLALFGLRGATALIAHIDVGRAFAAAAVLAVVLRMRTELVVGPLLIDFVLLIAGLCVLARSRPMPRSKARASLR